MTLTDYLNEMEYAITRVIESLWHEHDEAERLRKEIDQLQQVAANNYQRAQFIQQNAEDADDLIQGIFIFISRRNASSIRKARSLGLLRQAC